MLHRLSITLSFLILAISSHAQTLGTYPPGSVSAGSNLIVTPGSVPSNTSKIRVYASKGFSGILTAKASDGKIVITNAKPVGTYTVTVQAFNSAGSSTMRSFSLTVNKPECDDGRFNTSGEITGLDPNLTGVAVGDFNDDGKHDLAIAHEGFNTVTIRLGNGLGGFSGGTDVPVTSHPYALAIGDFDLDGKQDFVVTNQGNDIVAVRGGNGAGGFINYPNVTVGANPIGILLDDFNNDGKPDFATCNFNDNNISIRIGNGSGVFTGATTIPVAAYPAGIASGDFNSDGNKDLVTAGSGPGTLSVRFGNGTGGFGGNTEVAVGVNPNSVAVADFNGDGNLDLVSANYLSNTASVRLGDGFGNFSGNTEVNVGNGPYHVVVGNFNGDDYADIATANYFGNTVSIRLGDGTGGFSGTTEVAVGSYPTCIAVGNFNSDRRQDFAVTNYNDQSVSIRLGINGFTPPVAVTSNSPVCQGQSIQLNTYTGYTYYWTGPNGFTSTIQNPVIPVSTMNDAGVYNVVIRNNSNCTAISSGSVALLPSPVVDFSLATDTLCSGAPVLSLTSGTPSGGIYSGQGVVPGYYFDPGITGPGDFYLFYTYTDGNGCISSDTSKLHVLICTSVNENKLFSNYQLYPNPTSGKITVEFNAHSKTTIVLKVIDLLGKTLIAREVNAIDGLNTCNLDLENLSSGMYFVNMLNRGKEVQTLRIVVE